MGFFDKLKAGLSKTKSSFMGGLNSLFSGSKKIDEDFYDELEETLSDGISPQAFEDVDFKMVLNEFLEGLRPESRKVFLKRFFFLDTIPQIAADMGISESKVKSLLFRARSKFRSHILGKEHKR